MEIKDWILLLVPILCNGIIIFAFQKNFEKRQMIMMEKNKYVSVLQQKVDEALSMYAEMLQAPKNGAEIIQYTNEFINGYSKVFFYYQQNKMLLKPFSQNIEKINEIHEQIISVQRLENSVSHIEKYFIQIYEQLQIIQNKCINHKL